MLCSTSFLLSLILFKQGIDDHMDLGGLGPACFTVEEFNKRKVYIYMTCYTNSLAGPCVSDECQIAGSMFPNLN